MRDLGSRLVRLLAVTALLVAAGTQAAIRADGCPTGSAQTPRTLILALDGIPYRVMQEAREAGAFQGWPETRPLVSTFPSMTNVSFSAILKPFGAGTIRGYEVRHYDPETNKISGGGMASKKKSFAWKEYFQVIAAGNYAKARIYITPRSKSLSEMGDVEKLVETSEDEVMLAHVGATDSLTHFNGDEPTAKVLVKIAERIDTLREAHRERTGRELRVVLLSDHGNTRGKVRVVSGVKDALREAGLRPAEKREGPDDVVPVTYGVVGYAAMFAGEEHAETVARSVLALEGVDLAMWRTGEREIRVLSEAGDARIVWGGEARRGFAYLADEGDPLGLAEVWQRWIDEGRLDARGLVTEDAWFDASADGPYPDAPRRLVDSLAGTYVSNAATVLFSMEPGWAWGIRSARIGAWLRGGKLEATHGGLDRDSTLGFLLSSDETGESGAVRADRALAPWQELASCLGSSGAEVAHAGDAGPEQAIHGTD